MADNNIKHTKEPKGWECYWHEKGKNEGYRLGYENALKSQWHPYDKDIKGTWPKEGYYLIFQQKIYSWDQNSGQTTHRKQNFRCAYFKQGRWFYKKLGLGIYNDITHYQSITPPKDKKNDK